MKLHFYNYYVIMMFPASAVLYICCIRYIKDRDVMYIMGLFCQALWSPSLLTIFSVCGILYRQQRACLVQKTLLM